MAKPQSVQDKRPTPRLYLVTPVIEDAAAFSGTLRDALGTADVGAVLLRLKPAGERDLINRIKMLAHLVQEKDIALLLDGLPEFVARDGEHQEWTRRVHAGEIVLDVVDTSPEVLPRPQRRPIDTRA